MRCVFCRHGILRCGDGYAKCSVRTLNRSRQTRSVCVLCVRASSQVFRKNFRTQYAQMKLSHDYRWDWVVKQDKEDMNSRATIPGMSGGAAVFSHKSSFSRGINSSLGGLMEAVSVSSPAKKERRNSKNSISSALAGGESPSHTRALLQMFTGGQQQ